MTSKLYVGNLDYAVTNSDLEQYFEKFGTVVSAKVIIDRDTNRSKGFGFVEMSSSEEAEQAMNGLNGNDISGRTLKVNMAKEQEKRPRTGGGNGGGGNRDRGGDRGGWR
jgi:RNA recognition motif-containing protein